MIETNVPHKKPKNVINLVPSKENQVTNAAQTISDTTVAIIN